MKKIFIIFLFIIFCFSYPLYASLICSNCGSAITGNYWQLNGNIYCNECYQQMSPRCDRCGNIISGQYRTVNEKNYCENCYEAICPRCKICNAIIEGEYFTGNDKKSKYCKKCYDFYSHCPDCGVPAGPSGINLPDGRTLCSECYSVAIFDENKVEKIFEEVKEALKKSPGLTVKFPIKEIKLVNKTELNKLLENKTLEYIPHDGVSGLHYYEKINGRITISEIYILNWLTPQRIISVIAHEYSHAWQAENCPDKQESMVREGFAEWVSFKLLKTKGYKDEAEDMLKTADPVYGGGLKKYLELEKKYGKLGVFNYAKGGDPASKTPVVIKPERHMFIADITSISKIETNNFNKSLWFILILISIILIFFLISSIIKELRGK
jgi:hypothetical protein